MMTLKRKHLWLCSNWNDPFRLWLPSDMTPRRAFCYNGTKMATGITCFFLSKPVMETSAGLQLCNHICFKVRLILRRCLPVWNSPSPTPIKINQTMNMSNCQNFFPLKQIYMLEKCFFPHFLTSGPAFPCVCPGMWTLCPSRRQWTTSWELSSSVQRLIQSSQGAGIFTTLSNVKQTTPDSLWI